MTVDDAKVQRSIVEQELDEVPFILQKGTIFGSAVSLRFIGPVIWHPVWYR